MLSSAFTVLEVVLAGRAPHGDERGPAACKLAHRLLDAVGLTGHERRRFLTLSGGERQRVNLARVLAQLERPGDADAGYLFLDEPHLGARLRPAGAGAGAGGVVRARRQRRGRGAPRSAARGAPFPVDVRLVVELYAATL